MLAELPFARDDANRVIVDLAPPGKRPFPMMLDTGAQGSVMTPLMARRLGVTVRRMKSTPYRRSTLLGRDLQFRIDTRTSDTGSKTGWEYGLLGGNFLEHYVVEIDFPGRRVRFLDPREFEVPTSVSDPDEAIVPLKVTAKRPFAELSVDGQPVQVLLDTGAPPPLLISGVLARKVGIDVDALPEFGRMHFVLGSTEARLHECGSVELGFEQGPMPAIVVPRGSFNLGGATDSLVGYDLLAPFVVRLDYKRKRMWMRRTEPLAPRFYGMDYVLGKAAGAFLMEAPSSAIVMEIQPDGPAHRYGLRNGDHVIAEGVPTPDEVARAILAGEPLNVRRQNEDGWFDVMLPEAQDP